VGCATGGIMRRSAKGHGELAQLVPTPRNTELLKALQSPCAARHAPTGSAVGARAWARTSVKRAHVVIEGAQHTPVSTGWLGGSVVPGDRICGSARGENEGRAQPPRA
jgi:hypothetical protein